MKRMLGLAFLCHLVGTLLTIVYALSWPGRATPAYLLLWSRCSWSAAANGLVEIGINPLAATLYPTEKTHRLNVLHAWWPGGLMIGGLLSIALTKILGLRHRRRGPAIAAGRMFGWQIKMALILIPTLIYGVLFFTEKFPVTERVASGVSTRRDALAGAPADVPALGLLHAADRLDRAGPAGDAEPRAREDGRDERDVRS